MIGTLITKRQLPYARVLYESMQRHHPGEQMTVLLVDEVAGYFDPQVEPFEVLRAKDLSIAEFPALSFQHQPKELLEILKPTFLEYLLRERDFEQVLLLDAEIRIQRPLDEFFSRLGAHSMLLVPTYQQVLSSELEIDNVFHPGVIGVRRNPEVMEFLEGWREHQRLDLAVGLVDDLYIYRQPGALVGYWNLDPQTFEPAALRIFHHGGFQVDQPESISRYQDRANLADVPALRPLLEDYRQALMDAGYEECQRWSYHYDFFSDGEPIAPVMRHIWSRTKAYTLKWSDPRNVDGSDSFLNWLQSNVSIPSLKTGADQRGEVQTPLITNLAFEMYRMRIDWQNRFPDVFGLDRDSFVEWFINWAREENLPQNYYETVRQQHDALRRRPVMAVARKLYRYFVNWVYAVYRDERPLYRFYEALQPVLEIIWISQLFERMVASIFEEHNLLPVPFSLQPREEIILETELGVNVIGLLSDDSGLGRVARDLISALTGKAIPVAQIDLGGIPSRTKNYPITNLPEGNPHAINLIYFGGGNQYFYRLVGMDNLLRRYNIAYLWWELNRLPAQMANGLNVFNEVWVGSEFVREALEPVVSVPVYRMPIIIPTPAPAKLTRQDLGLPEDKHVFLFVFDPYSYIERKNPLGFIEAYRRAFGPDFKDTLLVLKCKGLAQFPVAAPEIRAAVKAVCGVLINRSVSRAEVDALFATCDAYVSLHRSEGYGATMAEAMLHKKPVIATNYSGNVDFMTPENSYPVPYQLIEITEDTGPYKKGNFWADPDLDEAARLMKHVVDYPEEARQKALQGCADIDRRHNEEAFSRAVIERLQKIHDYLRND